MLQGRNAIITGASQGLGYEIAREFLEQGASILICARDEGKVSVAVDSLRAFARNGSQQVLGACVDISDHDQVDAMFGLASDRFASLDVLVNNAAIQGPIGPFETLDWDAWAKTVDIILLGTAYVTYRAVAIMKKQDFGKIVSLSGGGATGPRANFTPYAVAKTGIVRLTETLAVECKESGIDINAIAPGAMNTHLMDVILEAGAERVGREYDKTIKQRENGGASLENAAKLCAWLASERSDGISGRLISAVWDDWENLDSHTAQLQESDIFTLRRIIPQDRGMNWDR